MIALLASVLAGLAFAGPWEQAGAEAEAALRASPVTIQPSRSLGELDSTIKFRWGGAGSGVLHLYAERGRSAPLVLVLPMTGDKGYAVSQTICLGLAAKGYRCAYLERPPIKALPKNLDDIFLLPALPPYSVERARRALDALEGMGELAAGEKVAVAGVSMGAIETALVAFQDRRVAAAALLLGGGNLPRILGEIDGKGVESFAAARQKQLEANHWGLADFETYMAGHTRDIDPLTFLQDKNFLAKRGLPADRFLMINATGDTAIPNACSDELYRAFSEQGVGKPDYDLSFPWSIVPGSWRHVGAVLDLGRVIDRMAGHFHKFLPTP